MTLGSRIGARGLTIAIVAAVAASALGQSLHWAAWYDGLDGVGGHPAALAEDGHGNVYVAGCSGVWTDADITTTKYDSAGTVRWAVRAAGPAGTGDEAVAIVVDGAGSVYVAGVCNRTPTDPATGDFYIVKYDADGKKLWDAVYDSDYHGADVPAAMCLDVHGNVIVTGSSTGASGGPEYLTISYAPDGGINWVARYHDNAAAQNSALAVATDAEGNAVVAGTSGAIKYDPNGGAVWAVTGIPPSGPSPAYGSGASSAVCDADGNVYVGGYQFSASGYGLDIVTYKYSPAGQLLWFAIHPNPGFGIASHGTFVALDSARNVYISAFSDSGGFAAPGTTVKYSNEGDELWHKDLSQGSSVAGMVVDADGNAYVVGAQNYVLGSQMLTVKYDRDGNELWRQRIGARDGSTNRGAAIAVSGDRVYVTGSSDIATLATDLSSMHTVTAEYANLPPAIANLRVGFENYAGPLALETAVEYRDPATGEVVHRSPLFIAANGDYADELAPVGTYDVALTTNRAWLRQVMRGVEVEQTGVGLSFSPACGDADRDNFVGLSDLSMVLSSFASRGLFVYADLNLDGVVSYSDLSIVLANFGLRGDD